MIIPFYYDVTVLLTNHGADDSDGFSLVWDSDIRAILEMSSRTVCEEAVSPKLLHYHVIKDPVQVCISSVYYSVLMYSVLMYAYLGFLYMSANLLSLRTEMIRQKLHKTMMVCPHNPKFQCKQ